MYMRQDVQEAGCTGGSMYKAGFAGGRMYRRQDVHEPECTEGRMYIVQYMRQDVRNMRHTVCYERQDVQETGCT